MLKTYKKIRSQHHRKLCKASEIKLAKSYHSALKVLSRWLKVIIIMLIITPTEIMFDSLLIISKNYKRSRKL